MKGGKAPTADTLKSFLHYNSVCGFFIWKPRERSLFKSKRAFGCWNTKYAGKRAGYHRKDGYLVIRLDCIGCKIYGHRAAWIIYYGELAPVAIDHINGNPADNRITNLRAATHKENQHNRRLGRDNSSGYKGVSFHRYSGRYRAYIRVNGKSEHVGYFDSALEAAIAHDERAIEAHGIFAKTNKMMGLL